jgi:hypothetical protein
MTKDEYLEEELGKLERGEFEEGSLHGAALDLVKEIFDLPGEEYTDQQCLRLIHYLTNSWSKLEDQGLY